MHIFITMPEMAQKYACSNLLVSITEFAPPSGQSALFVHYNLPLCVSLCGEFASSYVKDNIRQVVLSITVTDVGVGAKKQRVIYLCYPAYTVTTCQQNVICNQFLENVKRKKDNNQPMIIDVGKL